jgi:hypothetical protein
MERFGMVDLLGHGAHGEIVGAHFQYWWEALF